MSGEQATRSRQSIREGCHGVPALPARLETWQMDALEDAAGLRALMARHGSPVNLIEPGPMAGHADDLLVAAESRGVETRLFFARKANKALGLVDEALRAGHGVDVASLGELDQVISRGACGDDVIVTAAIKPRTLLERAVDVGAMISVDNLDELALLVAVARKRGRPARTALRCAPQHPDIPMSRFGMTAAEIRTVMGRSSWWDDATLEGFHFHLSGYEHRHRAVVLDQVLDLVDEARALGHLAGFVDIGGGVPMRYLDSPEPWDAFWEQHHAALRGDAPSMTWGGHTLGLGQQDGAIRGKPAVYPMWQEPVRGAWLARVLDAPARRGGTVADRLRGQGVALHLEPGRALLDGCGMTVARVESRKRAADGTWYVGLAMNRTQCRSAADDFLVDPILVPSGEGARTEPIEGYLVGAYCIEAELLTLRRLRFPQGVAVGDMLTFVNTAGYMMHILESASHQIPLARNLVATDSGWRTDDIDG